MFYLFKEYKETSDTFIHNEFERELESCRVEEEDDEKLILEEYGFGTCFVINKKDKTINWSMKLYEYFIEYFIDISEFKNEMIKIPQNLNPIVLF